MVDFTVALEALLLPYDREARRGDWAYRFRVHGALYISSEANERISILEDLTQIYSMRSRLVHGSKYPDDATLRKTRTKAYELTRRGLLRAVNEGFPDAKKFSHMVIGVGTKMTSSPES